MLDHTVDSTARQALLSWYAARKRPLPWRATTDPYAIWVSEMMLQQTRVETVIPYFTSWMQHFPSLAALAAASEEQVMAAWSGLGYYSRARNLHRAARLLATSGRAVPSSPDELRKLPGIGPYSAGAIASIAFGIAVPCVDGNVVRVVSRHAGLREPIDAAALRNVGKVATAWVESAADAPGDWNQAVMELGATICTPRNPSCTQCPISFGCDARGIGDQANLPNLLPRRVPQVEQMRFAAIFDPDRTKVLLVKLPPTGLLAGTWGLPGGKSSTSLAQHVRVQTGLSLQFGSIAKLTHKFTHRTWLMEIHVATTIPSARIGESSRWVALDALDDLGLSTAMRKAIGAAIRTLPTSAPLVMA